ncbi:hypothetical protein CDAR_400031 [Caerostris darwini]|uniref:Uncharacterized protein n=1 Tax=Caerostris darwini TaxID=1538125 RepID=A0AAV4NAW9_9ARAC|nr:hypothetical protein CDAR_400031 [Caerostris darwini]
MLNLLPIDIRVLWVRCNIISREIQDLRSVCSYVTESSKLLISAEINNLAYPLCRNKQEEVFNFLGVVISHRKAIEALVDRCSDFRRMLMQHGYTHMLLKKMLEEELHLFDMMRNMGEAQIGLLQYDNELKLHEMSLY